MANWFYTMSGGMSTVQVLTGGNIPNIPGSVRSDMSSIGVNPAYYLKNIIKQVWNINAANINYTSLPKLSNNGKYQFGYWWNGRYNKSVGNVTHNLEFDTTPSTKFYIGGAAYFNGCASHRHAGYNNNALVLTASVTYVDGGTESFTLKSPYIGATSSVGQWNIMHQIGNVYNTSKAFNHIKVVSQFNNAGAVWHDVGDRGPNNGWYKNKSDELKAGYPINQLFILDYTSFFNLPYWNGGVSGNNVTEDPKTTLPINL